MLLLRPYVLPLFLFVLASLSAPLRAHEFLPAIAEVDFDRDAKQYVMKIELNLEALIAEVEPDLTDTNDSMNAERYDTLRALSSDELGAEFEGFKDRFETGLGIKLDGRPSRASVTAVEIPEVGNFELPRVSVVTINGALPNDVETFQWQWVRDFGTISFKAENETSREAYVALLDPGEASDVLEIDNVRERSGMELFLDYIVTGFDHILPKGLDHILFVVGIFLLSPRWGPILWQVTAFTLAHTVTLGLGAAGIVSIPGSVVEPLIAASICYVAIENIFRPTLSPWRPIVVFAFGLLHGLGFAGVLGEFGIPESQFLVALLGFNIGVEMGQLTVILICFALVGWAFGKKPWYRRVVTIPGSVAIALVGAYWVLERTLL